MLRWLPVPYLIWRFPAEATRQDPVFDSYYEYEFCVVPIVGQFAPQFTPENAGRMIKTVPKSVLIIRLLVSIFPLIIHIFLVVYRCLFEIQGAHRL